VPPDDKGISAITARPDRDPLEQPLLLHGLSELRDEIVADRSETAAGRYMDVGELDIDGGGHDDDLAGGSERIASRRAANTPR
jgi:hypothetical protein